MFALNKFVNVRRLLNNDKNFSVCCFYRNDNEFCHLKLVSVKALYVRFHSTANRTKETYQAQNICLTPFCDFLK
jgi:hypothetical protein